LHGIRGRFIGTFAHLTEADFIGRGEKQAIMCGCAKSVSERRLRRPTMRSRYVHSDKSFGDIVKLRGGNPAEVQTGRPVIDDKAKAPTWIGLERIVRHGLWRFAQEAVEGPVGQIINLTARHRHNSRP